MNKEQCITPKEYLDRHLEPRQEQEERLSMPFFKDGFEWSYGGDDEVFAHSDGERSLSFDCQHVEDDFAMELRKIMDSKFPEAKDKEKHQKFFAPPMFVLRDLSICEDVEEGQEFGLKQYLVRPGRAKDDGVVVLVQPKDVDADEEVLNSILGKGVVFLSGNLINLDTLLILAHEIGHQQVRKEGTEAMAGYMRGRPISKEEGMSVLREERDAWAFAIKALKPFIPRERLADVNNLIHHDALTNHSNHIRGQVAPDWVAGVCRFIDIRVREWEKKQRQKNIVLGEGK